MPAAERVGTPALILPLSLPEAESFLSFPVRDYVSKVKAGFWVSLRELVGPNRFSDQEDNIGLPEMGPGEFESFFDDERFLWIAPFKKELQFFFHGNA